MTLEPELIATLVSRGDVTPSLPLIIRRSREGSPISNFSLGEIRRGIAQLREALDRAETALNSPSLPINLFPLPRLEQRSQRLEEAS